MTEFGQEDDCYLDQPAYRIDFVNTIQIFPDRSAGKGRFPMHVELNPVRLLRKYSSKYLRAKISRLVSRYNMGGFNRIYHYHIRKTAGTSLAKMFLSLNGNDGERLFAELGNQSDRPLLRDGLIFVGWDKRLIEQGEYFFGFSHHSFDQLNLPANTFRFTSFRDPVERLVSHYRMLLDFSKQQNPHPCFATEGQWLGNSIGDFLDRIPREHLQNQLYMFSSDFCVEQAVDRVRCLDHWLFVDSFEQGLQTLEDKAGQQLARRHDRKSIHKLELPIVTRNRIREMLDDEYRFLDGIKYLGRKVSA